MGIKWIPCGHGQRVMHTGRKNGWSKHSKFDQYGNYVGQYTKTQTNKKRNK